MGIIIKVTAQCGCKKDGVNMDIVTEVLDEKTNTVTVVFACPKCHIQKRSITKLYYVDFYKGMKTYDK
jgi:hypothetical protein